MNRHSSRAVVLVEGISDQRALTTLATRRGRDLEAEGVSVVPIGGAHAVGPYLARGTGRFATRLCSWTRSTSAAFPVR